MQKPTNRAPSGQHNPFYISPTDDTQPTRPGTITRSVPKASITQSPQAKPIQSRPAALPEAVNHEYLNRAIRTKPASRHTMRGALATGTTMAALIGAQAIAVFGRTAQAKPVIVGARAGDTATPLASMPTQTDVPVSSVSLLPSATPQPSATLVSSSTSLPSMTPLPSTTPLPSATAVPRVFYTVQSGDTLGVIAARFKTTVQTIMALNADRLANPNLVQVGQKLLISGPVPTTPTQVPPSTVVPSPTQDSVSNPVLASSDATQVSTWTPQPTDTSIPTWTPIPTQVHYYQAPIQPAPRTKSS